MTGVPETSDALAGRREPAGTSSSEGSWALANQEIGEELIISPATVKTHISRLLMKLDARDRARLVVIAYESGLVTARKPGS
jgi:hypothetical protein